MDATCVVSIADRGLTSAEKDASRPQVVAGFDEGQHFSGNAQVELFQSCNSPLSL